LVHKKDLVDYLPWLRAAFPAKEEDAPYIATPECREHLSHQMVLNKNSRCTPLPPLLPGG